MSRLLNLFAATASVGLFIGLLYWGVTISQMDPNEIPVIKRAAGPARIAPDDPGGEQANHQGLSVNTVQAKGGAGDTAMQVVLAPKPRPFQPEDVAGLEKAKPTLVEKKADNSPVLKPIEAALVVPEAQEGTNKPAEQLEQAQTVAKANTDETVQSVLLPTTKITRPQKRPKSLKLSIAPTGAKTTATNDLPVGTPLVQVGAFKSNDIANAQLAKFSTKHKDLLGDKSFLIQKAKSNGKTFYRLRVKGFDNSNDAKNFCSALKARSADCLISIVR